MATFFTDSDLTGSGEFVEAEVALATEFTVPDCTVVPRWRWPTIAPVVTPTINIYNAGGTLVAGPIGFDSSTLDAWNSAGAASPVALSAGTYRVTVNTTRYVAKSGFFGGGSVTRGSITGVQSRFGSPGSAPTSTSTAAYFVDVDLSGGATSAAAALSVTVSLSAAAADSVAPAAALAVTATLAAAVGRTAVPAAALVATATLAADSTSMKSTAAALAVVATLLASTDATASAPGPSIRTTGRDRTLRTAVRGG